MFLELSSSAFSKQGVLQSHQCSASFGSSDIPAHREMLALPRDTGGTSPVRQVGVTICPRHDAIETLPIPNVEPQGRRIPPAAPTGVPQHWLAAVPSPPGAVRAISFLGTVWQGPASGRTQVSGYEGHGRQVGRGAQGPNQGPTAKEGQCGGIQAQNHFPGRLSGSSATALSRAKLLWQLLWPFSSC